jgi:F-box/WD-40 domain protein MET30
VQSMKLLHTEECGQNSQEDLGLVHSNETNLQQERRARPPLADRRKPFLISGSLDNTIKIWDIESGKAIRTFFGHIEGVWSVACDKLRLVSGSHDRTIKVWSRDEGRCTATLVGHQAAVSCVALGEDKIVSGSDDTDIRVWSFSS